MGKRAIWYMLYNMVIFQGVRAELRITRVETGTTTVTTPLRKARGKKKHTQTLIIIGMAIGRAR